MKIKKIKIGLKRVFRLIALGLKWFGIGFGILLLGLGTCFVGLIPLAAYLAYKKGREIGISETLQELGLSDEDIRYIIEKLNNKAEIEFNYQLDEKKGEVVKVD